MSDRYSTGIQHLYRSGLTLALSILITACASTGEILESGTTPGAPTPAPKRINTEQMLADLEFLASDELMGRRTGTPGNAEARAFLLRNFQEIGLQPLGESYTQEFEFVGRRDEAHYRGVNLIGYLPGTVDPDQYIVVSAHYDHLGVGAPDETGDSIYNGADDNAGGTAALLALARHLRRTAPRHSIIFAAFDAEELGLQGARAFVADPPVPLESIMINVNMDMITRNDQNELYAAGVYHYPFLRPYVERVADRSSITLLMGHDHGEVRSEDWTFASDHGAFHGEGIPFIYFGVEDHEDYHRPSDEFDNIHPDFYGRAVETILDLILEIDRNPPRS